MFIPKPDSFPITSNRRDTHNQIKTADMMPLEQIKAIRSKLPFIHRNFGSPVHTQV